MLTVIRRSSRICKPGVLILEGVSHPVSWFTFAIRFLFLSWIKISCIDYLIVVCQAILQIDTIWGSSVIDWNPLWVSKWVLHSWYSIKLDHWAVFFLRWCQEGRLTKDIAFACNNLIICIFLSVKSKSIISLLKLELFDLVTWLIVWAMYPITLGFDLVLCKFLLLLLWGIKLLVVLRNVE